MEKIITSFTQSLPMLAASAVFCCGAHTAGAASIGTPTYAAATSPTDLSAVGTLDWKLYGKQYGPTETPSQSKSGGTSITRLAPVITSPNAADNTSISRSSATFNWSDGIPTASGTAVDPYDNGWNYANAATVAYFANYETVTFVPGDTKLHTVHLYGYQSGTPITFLFSNSLAGASSVVNTFTPASPWDYSVSFQADNPTDVFTVVLTWQKTGGTATAKRGGIQAATIDAYVPPSLSWQGNVNSAWNIDATANWINSSGAAVNYTETGGVGDASVTFDDTAVNYLVNVTTAVHPLAILVNNSANNYVLSNSPSASLGGPGALTKQGAGVLTLVGAGNSFSNGVALSGGTLRLGASESLPDGTGRGNATMSANSTLDLNGYSETLNGLSNPFGGGTVDNVAGGGTSILTVGNNNASSTFSGTIQNSSGTVGLNKTGTGSLTLSGTNTFSGGVTLNAGKLILNSPGALGYGSLTFAASGVQLDNTSGAVLTLATTNAQFWNGDFTFVGSRNLNFGPGAVTMNASRIVQVNNNSLAVGGPVAGSGFGLAKNGGGTLQLNYSNTFNGPITVNAGLLHLSTAHSGGGSVTLAANANLQVNSGLPGTTLSVSSLAFGTASGNTNVLTLNFGTSANPATALVTAGVLSAPNSVKVNISGSGLTVGQFPLIKYGGSIGGVGFAAFQLGTLPYPSFVATLVDNSANQSIDLNITAAGGPPKIWVGNVNNHWDISTTTNWLDSILSVPAVYTETLLAGDVALFDDTASNATVNVVAPVKPASVTVSSSNLNFTIGGAAIIGPGSFTKSGAAALTLTGNNTFTNNFNLQGGTVYVGANGALGAGQVNWSGGTVSSDGAIARSVTNALAVSGNPNFGDGGVGSGNLTFSGPVNWGANARTLTANADVLLSGGSTNGTIYKAGPNTVTLQGTNNLSGRIHVVNGTLRLNAAWVTNTDEIRVVVNQTNSTARLAINGGALVTTGGGVLRIGYSDFGNTTAGGIASMATNILDVAGVLDLMANHVTMGRAAALCELNLLLNGELRTASIQGSEISANNTPDVVNFNGGVLRATTNNAAFFQGIENAYVKAGGAIIDSSGYDITINQALQAPVSDPSGGLTKNGAGALTLGGANTYAGSSVINGGELVISTSATGGGAITVADAGSLGLALAAQGGTLNASAVTLGTTASHNGTLDINFGVYSPDLYNAPLNLTGSLSAAGTNTINLIATNGIYIGQYPLIKYSGGLASGVFNTFKLGSLPALVDGVLVNNTANQSIDINVTRGLQVPVQWYGWVNGNWDMGTSNWMDSSYVQAAYREISGLGPAVSFLDAASTYSVNVLTPVSPYSMTVNAASEYTIGGAPIAGAGILTKSGFGALNLTSSNSYSGGTLASQGTLRLGANGALGSGVLTLSGATLTSDGVVGRTNNLAGVKITAATILGDAVNTGPLSLGGTVNWNNAERALTIASDVVLSGGSTNGAFSKTGTGVLTLRGNHAFTKLADVYQGDVVFDAVTATVTNGAPIRPNCNIYLGVARVALANGASVACLDAGSPNIRVGVSGDPSATNILDLSGPMTAGPGGLAILGTSCALGEVNLLSGGALAAAQVTSGDSLTYNGESRLNFNGGTLRAISSSTNFLNGLSNVLVLNGGAAIDSSNYNITVTQPLLYGGTGGLTKTGNGVLTLDSVNTYTNTTLVSAGTLAGTGTIAGPLSVGANGTLAPGDNGIGTFTIQGPLTLAAGSTNYFEVNAASGASDRVTGLTRATYAGVLVVSNVASGTPPTNSRSFQIFSAVAAPAGNFSSIVPAPAAGLAWSFNPTNGVLKAVPGAAKNPPVITSVTSSNGNLVVSGTNGVPGGTYLILSSTNVALARANWLPMATNTFDGTGAFKALIPVTTTEAQRFFLLQQ